jgi:hypothetical protein
VPGAILAFVGPWRAWLLVLLGAIPAVALFAVKALLG